MENFIHAYSWINIRFLLQGLWVTIYVSLISIALSFILGLVFGFIRYVKIKYLSTIVGFVIDIIRNLPLLLIIFFTYFGLPELGIVTNPTVASIIALVVFILMKLVNKFTIKKEAEKETPAPSNEEIYLRQIRDALQEKKILR